MTSPGLAVPEEPHQPLSFKFPKRLYGHIAALETDSAHIAALET